MVASENKHIGYPLICSEPPTAIIDERGPRTPAVADSQKAFRAAFVLVADREHPPEQDVLEELSAFMRGFSNPANDADDATFNFHEATGGRATFATGDLTRWRKPGAAVALAGGARPRDVRTFVASRPSRFGGAIKANPHLLCGTEHLGNAPGASNPAAFGSADGPSARFVGAADPPGPYPIRP